MPLTPGTRLGSYEIVSPLGSGGMGEVYKAKDLKLGRDVAIKVLREDLASDPERLRRFEQEARAASSLNHPNIVTIYDIGEHEGTRYIAMEYVEGKTLREMLGGEPLPTKKLLKLSTQIADGLAKAHAAGIVHRDLKPENLMVTGDGFVKILDFGLAKLLPDLSDTEGETMAKEVTTPGVVMGTTGYMSPEQAKGQPADFHSDQFSLGVVLYEMASGRRAFQADTTGETLAAIIRDEPESVAKLNPDLPAPLRWIVERCLAKDQEERYGTTRDLAHELQNLRDHLADLTSAPSVLPEPQAIGRSRRTMTLFWVGAFVVILALIVGLNVGGLRERMFGGAAPGRIESIAVLPLENLSGDPEQEYFADGMTEALIADLAKIGALKVISRTSAMRYKGSDKPLPEIARELNVDAVVEGSAMRVGDRVRITAQLIEAATDQHLWAESYERDLTDILALQGEVARTIAQEIQVTLTSQEDTLLASARPVNPEAHEAYLRGRHFLGRGNKRREDYDKALIYFQQALEKDPNYAPAYVGLADTYSSLGASGFGGAPKETMPKAREAVSKALELDDSLADAHWTLSRIKSTYDWDWVGGKRESQRFLELSPGSARAHWDRGWWLTFEGRHDDALVEMERALELDPLNLRLKSNVGFLFYLHRRYERAESELLSVLELDPTRAGWTLIEVYVSLERFDEAVLEFKKSLSLVGVEDAAAVLDESYAELGFPGAMRRLAESMVESSLPEPWESIDIAWAYGLAGEVDQAIQWLERAYEERDNTMITLNSNPRWDPLRADPRFQDLLRRMNFPE